MEINNWRSTLQNGQPADNWRLFLMPDSRQRITKKIMETLKRHLQTSDQQGSEELKKIAVRFEEKIYATATSQSDYLRKISLKMLTLETRNQSNSLPSASYANGSNNLPRDFEVNITRGLHLAAVNTNVAAVNTARRKRHKKNDGGEVVDEVMEVHNTTVDSDETEIESDGSTIKECNQKLDEMQMLAVGDPLYIAACCIFCESKAHCEQWIMLSAKPEEVRIDWIKMVAKRLGYL